MKLITIKYAAELNILDLDPKYQYTFIKRYRYKSEDREKAMTIYKPFRITHTYELGAATGSVQIGYKERYYTEFVTLPINTEIAIFGPEE